MSDLPHSNIDLKIKRLRFELPLIVVSDIIVFRKRQVYIIQLYKILVHLVGDKQRLFMILKLLKIMNLLLKLEILSLLLKRLMQIGGKVNSMGKQVNKISRNRW